MASFTERPNGGWQQTYRLALHTAALMVFMRLAMGIIIEPIGRSGAEFAAPFLLAMWFQRVLLDNWGWVPLLLLLHLFVELRGWIRPESKLWLAPQTAVALIPILITLMAAPEAGQIQGWDREQREACWRASHPNPRPERQIGFPGRLGFTTDRTREVFDQAEACECNHS